MHGAVDFIVRNLFRRDRILRLLKKFCHKWLLFLVLLSRRRECRCRVEVNLGSVYGGRLEYREG